MSIPDIMLLKKLLHTSVINSLKEIDEGTLQKLKSEISAKDFEFIKIAIDNLNMVGNEMLESTGSMATFLGALILEVIILKKKINILLVKESEDIFICIEGNLSSSEYHEYIEYFKTKSHIVLPLTNLLEDFIKLESNEKHLRKFGLLSKNELEILDCIRNNDIREIILKKDQDRNITLTTKQDKKFNERESEMIRSILAKNDFIELRAIKRNHKELFLEGTKKTKLPAENG